MGTNAGAIVMIFLHDWTVQLCRPRKMAYGLAGPRLLNAFSTERKTADTIMRSLSNGKGREVGRKRYETVAAGRQSSDCLTFEPRNAKIDPTTA